MFDSLLQQLKSKEPYLRAQAARQIGSLRVPEAFPALKESLHDADINVRRAALEALGELSDLRAIELLVDFSENEDLSTFEEDIQLLPSPILAILVSFGAPAVDILLGLINNHLAIAALGEIGDSRAFEPLLNIAEDSGDEIWHRLNAISALGRLKDKRAFKTLAFLAHSSIPNIKSQAITALGELGDPRAIQTLSEFLFIPSPDPHYIDLSHHFNYADSAALALARLGSEEALITLLNHARTPNALYRSLTFGQLVYIDDPRVDELFSEMLHNRNEEMWWNMAIQHFWRIGGAGLLQSIQATVPPEPAQEIERYINRSTRNK